MACLIATMRLVELAGRGQYMAEVEESRTTQVGAPHSHPLVSAEERRTRCIREGSPLRPGQLAYPGPQKGDEARSCVVQKEEPGNRRMVERAATLCRQSAAPPGLNGDMQLFCVPVLIEYGDEIPESQVERALEATIRAYGLNDTIGMEIRRQNRSPHALLETWYPMRELGRATIQQARAATAAKSLQDLSSIVSIWTRCADTPLRRGPAHAFFLIGLHERERDGECLNGSARLVDAEVLLADFLAEILGIRPIVTVTIFDEFFEGLYEGIWQYQSKRLLHIAADLKVTAEGGTIEVELCAERSSECDTVLVSFDGGATGRFGGNAFRLAGRPGDNASTTLNRIHALLAGVPGVAFAVPRITSRAERITEPRGSRKGSEPLSVWI